jgi:hypothetical protein
MKLHPTYSGRYYYGFIKPAPHSVKKQAKGFMIFNYFYEIFYFILFLKQEGESRGAGAG